MDGFRLTNLCVELDFGCSNAHAKAVLVALAMSFNAENEEVWVGVDTLVRRSACTRNTVFKALAWLEEHGLIVKRRTQRSNHYRFNLALIQSGALQGVKFNTSQSIKSRTVQSIESNTLQSMKTNTRTNKEQIKEQIINQSVPMGNSAPVASVSDLKNCFQSFGSNPVSRPTQWEPDEDDFDQPLRNQIAQAQRIDVNLNDESRILSASEMVVLAATLGYRLTHNVVLDEIADERVITTGMMKEAIQRAKDRTYGVGGLVRILQNAVRDPMAFNGIRKKPDVTADTLSDGQAYHFAKSLANYHPWASNNAKYMETMEQMIDRVSVSIKNPEFFNNCRWALEKLGLVKEAAA